MLHKRFVINTVLANIYQLTKFGGLMNCVSKDLFKNALLSHACTNTHDDVKIGGEWGAGGGVDAPLRTM